MDPDTTLAELRSAVSDYEDNGRRSEDADRMRDAFVALDEWLLDGGYFPAEWRKGRPVN